MNKLFTDVIDLHLEPKRPYTERKKTNLVLLHNVGGTMTAEAIHKMHMADAQKGYAGIAYNLYIDKDGKRYWGRGPDYAGGSVKSKGKTAGMNARAFAIVCNGDFNREYMSQLQKDALFLSVAEACLNPDWDINSITQIKGHGEVDDTDCPGKHFPLDELREYIRTYKPKLTEDPAADPISAIPPTFHISKILKNGMDDVDVCHITRNLTALGFIDRDCTSVFDDEVEKAVRAFQKKYGLTVDGIVGRETTETLGGVWDGR